MTRPPFSLPATNTPGEMDKPLISRRLVDSDASLAEAASGAPKVGILGTGDFARSLATRLVRSGFSVLVGSRNPKRTAGLFPLAAQVVFQVEAVDSSEVIFVAVFREHYSSLCGLSSQLAGKILVDVSNPTEQEHLQHRESNAEYLAALFPTCTVVKAFNVISAWTLQAGPRDGNRQVGAGDGEGREECREITTIMTINIMASFPGGPSAHQALCAHCLSSAHIGAVPFHRQETGSEIVMNLHQAPPLATWDLNPFPVNLKFIFFFYGNLIT